MHRNRKTHKGGGAMRREIEEFEVEKPETCPNCGCRVGNSQACDNCGAVLSKDEDFGDFDLDEDTNDNY